MHKITSDRGGWETLRLDEKYKDNWVGLNVEQVRRPSGPEPQTWTVVHRPAAAVVAPFTRDGRLVLVRQERIPIRAAIWEFPAGQIDEAHEEDWEIVNRTALREMHEESGFVPGPGFQLIPLGVFFSSPGFTDEHCYLFAAKNVVEATEQARQDADESILDVGVFGVQEVRRMIHEGIIRDGNTLALFARLCAAGIL